VRHDDVARRAARSLREHVRALLRPNGSASIAARRESALSPTMTSRISSSASAPSGWLVYRNIAAVNDRAEVEHAAAVMPKRPGHGLNVKGRVLTS
jgi:hypothetical protein